MSRELCHPSVVLIHPVLSPSRLSAAEAHGGVYPRMGTCNGEVSATIGCTPHILHIHASMTGLARYPTHTANAHATTPQIGVSCSLGHPLPAYQSSAIVQRSSS